MTAHPWPATRETTARDADGAPGRVRNSGIDEPAEKDRTLS